MTDTKYGQPVDRLLSLGETHLTKVENWQDYLALGIGPEHIPDLLRMVNDEELNEADSENPEVWAPVHALRALGQLRDESVIQPLLQILEDEEGDEWIQEDTPRVFSLIGPGAIPALSDFLADPSRNVHARGYAAESLRAIAERHPESRSSSIEGMTRTLERYKENDYDLNALIINDLTQLKAVETVPLIEQAFDSGMVEEFFIDLDSVLIEMGLKEPEDEDDFISAVEELDRSLFKAPAYIPKPSDFKIVTPDFPDEEDDAPVVDSQPVQASKPLRNFESIKFSRNKPKKKKKKKR